MAILPGSLTQSATGNRLSLSRVLAFLAALLVTLAIVLAGDQVERLGAYGYPAVFLVSLLSNAALLLPGPGIALVIAASSTLDPLVVGVVAGLGATLGEMTGYFVGQSGQVFFEERPIYWRIERWMRKSGTVVIFMLAAIPNPLFDIGGLVAGALRMPIWRFLLIVWLGKSLRFTLLATIGAMAI
jgi:membrane protein YqaA with SNARE-associated domain